MKCQILFSGKNKKNIINLSSAENAQRVVKVKQHKYDHLGVWYYVRDHVICYKGHAKTHVIADCSINQ